MSDPVSQELFARASQVIPGGVNSPVRAFRAVGGEPVFIKEACGPVMTGADGTEYVDYVGLSDELHKLAAEADVVVNSTPLTPATTGMFDKKFFAAMKPGAYFINVGRGKSVVTGDLVEALSSGRIGGAGLDVQDPEPLPSDHPLWKARNVIITPHISAGSDAQMKRFWLLVRENLRRYVNGERMLNVVDIKRGY